MTATRHAATAVAAARRMARCSVTPDALSASMGCLRSSRIRSRQGCNSGGPARPASRAPHPAVDANQRRGGRAHQGDMQTAARRVPISRVIGATSAVATRSSASRQRARPCRTAVRRRQHAPDTRCSGSANEAGPDCVAGSPNGSHGGGAAKPPDHTGSLRRSPVRRVARNSGERPASASCQQRQWANSPAPRRRCARSANDRRRPHGSSRWPAARASAGSRPSSAVQRRQAAEDQANRAGGSSATAVRGVRGRPRNTTPNRRTAASATRPTDSAASAATPTISNCMPKSPMRAAASSDWNSSQNAAKPRPGGSTAAANRPTRQQPAVTGMRWISPPRRSSRRVPAPLSDSIGAHAAAASGTARGRPAPARPRRAPATPAPAGPPRGRTAPRRARSPPCRTGGSEPTDSTCVQRVRECRAQRADCRDRRTYQHQRHTPPQRLPCAAEIEQHADHQIDCRPRADRLSTPRPDQRQQHTTAARHPSGGAARIAAKSAGEPARASATQADHRDGRRAQHGDAPSNSNPPPGQSHRPPAPSGPALPAAAARVAQGDHEEHSSRKLAASGSSARCIAGARRTIGSTSDCRHRHRQHHHRQHDHHEQMPALPAATAIRGTTRVTAASTTNAATRIASRIRTTASPAWGATRSRHEG